MSYKPFGTAAKNLVELPTAGKLPALDGSDLTNLPGGSPAWGDITGTLSAQTDLQAALDAKAVVFRLTYTAGSPSAWQFQPNGTPDVTSSIVFGSGLTNLLTNLEGNTVVFTDTDGISLGYILGPFTGGDTFTVYTQTAVTDPWSGVYSVAFWPGGNGVTKDTGWTANASAGDKTQAVANYSGSGIDGTMAAALELVSSGLGTALQQDEDRIRELIKKVQALEFALAARLLPNT